MFIENKCKIKYKIEKGLDAEWVWAVSWVVFESTVQVSRPSWRIEPSSPRKRKD